MKERPILYNGPMVRAILADMKTQTRRVVKLPHQNPLGVWEPTTIGGPNGGRLRTGETIPEQGAIWHTHTGDCISYSSQPGDRLWVRETFAHVPIREDDGGQGDRMGYIYRADGESAFDAIPDEWDFIGPWKPSIFMPRAASRITLEVTGVRVERLQDISEEDAKAEGIGRYDNGTFGLDNPAACMGPTAVVAYHRLWDHINGPGSWAENPYVWVIEFNRVQA